MEELTQYIKADGTHVLRDWTGLSVGRIALCQLRQLGSRSV